MKFGINTILFSSPFTNECLKYFEKFTEWGFDGVEITLENKGDIDYEKTLSKLNENHLSCLSIGGAFSPDRDLRGTKIKQENSKKYIRDCIDACVKLNCGLFMGPLYSSVGRANMETEEAKKEQWSMVIKNLKEICKYAEEKGVYIALEPLNRFETDFINTCDQAKSMINDVGSSVLKIHLDTFHMNIEEKSISGAIINAGDLLYNFHASENDRGTPGTGHINWGSIKKSLKIIGYNKAIVIESFTKDVKIIAKAASIWRDIEKSNEDLAMNGIKFLKSFFKCNENEN